MTSRRGFLKLAGLGGAGVVFVAASYALPTWFGSVRGKQSGYPVSPYISKTEQLESLPESQLSFYKQPWRGYLETVPATDFLSGIGINYSLRGNVDHDTVIGLLADSGVRHARVEMGWSEVPWDESELTNRAGYVSIFAACRRHQVVPLILL